MIGDPGESSCVYYLERELAAMAALAAQPAVGARAFADERPQHDIAQSRNRYCLAVC